MTFRTKLLAALVLVALIGNGILAYTDCSIFTRLLQVEVHRKVRSIADTTAAMLNPEMVAQIRTPAQQSTPEYSQVLRILNRVRDTNRRQDTYVERIFTLIPSKQNSNVLEYGVDTETNFEYAHQVGDIYQINDKPVNIGLAGLARQETPGDYHVHYPAGYDTAYAVIRDKAGKVVAGIAVVAVPPSYGLLTEIRPKVMIPFGVSILLSLLVGVLLSKRMSRPLYGLRKVIEAVGQGDLDARVNNPTKDEFGEIGTAVNAMTDGLRERDTIKRAFSGYISRQVLEAILSSGGGGALRGERRRVTVLFADIRGFTAMSETMQPEEVVGLLSDFFGRMVEVVMRNQGTIDKFLGDGMMVIFGAPQDDSYQEEHAVMAAIEMQQELRILCENWQNQGRRPIRMGIGINSGNAIVGNIGPSEHMEYTAIGDTVNLASRLETASKEVGVDILISEHTYEGARPAFKWKPTGPVRVRGREEPILTFSVEGAVQALSADGSSTPTATNA